MNRSIIVFEAAFLGAAVARACGYVEHISVYSASIFGGAIHRRFYMQSREVRVI